MVTGWSPAVGDERVGGGGEVAEGASWGPGTAVVGMTEEVRGGAEEGVGKTNG